MNSLGRIACGCLPGQRSDATNDLDSIPSPLPERQPAPSTPQKKDAIQSTPHPLEPLLGRKSKFRVHTTHIGPCFDEDYNRGQRPCEPPFIKPTIQRVLETSVQRWQWTPQAIDDLPTNLLFLKLSQVVNLSTIRDFERVIVETIAFIKHTGPLVALPRCAARNNSLDIDFYQISRNAEKRLIHLAEITLPSQRGDTVVTVNIKPISDLQKADRARWDKVTYANIRDLAIYFINQWSLDGGACNKDDDLGRIITENRTWKAYEAASIEEMRSILLSESDGFVKDRLSGMPFNLEDHILHKMKAHQIPPQPIERKKEIPTASKAIFSDV